MKELSITSSPKVANEQLMPSINVLASNGAVQCELEIHDLRNRPLEEAILFAVRGRVEILSIWGFHIKLVASHFVGLRELHLNSMPKEDTNPLWRALGPSLELLFIRVSGEEMDEGTLGSIQLHCRKLTSVQICFADDAWKAHADLLISYGDQLKDVGFSRDLSPLTWFRKSFPRVQTFGVPSHHSHFMCRIFVWFEQWQITSMKSVAPLVHGNALRLCAPVRMSKNFR